MNSTVVPPVCRSNAVIGFEGKSVANILKASNRCLHIYGRPFSKQIHNTNDKDLVASHGNPSTASARSSRRITWTNKSMKFRASSSSSDKKEERSGSKICLMSELRKESGDDGTTGTREEDHGRCGKLAKNKLNCYRTISLCTQTNRESQFNPDSFFEDENLISNRNNKLKSSFAKSFESYSSLCGTTIQAYGTTGAPCRIIRAGNGENSNNEVFYLAKQKSFPLSVVREQTERTFSQKGNRRDRSDDSTMKNGVRRPRSEKKQRRLVHVHTCMLESIVATKHNNKSLPRSPANSTSEESADKSTLNIHSADKMVLLSRHYQDKTCKLKTANTCTDRHSTSDASDRPNLSQGLQNDDNIDTSVRIMEWLSVVNSIEEYDINPNDLILEYREGRLKKETAIHIVYDGD